MTTNNKFSNLNLLFFEHIFASIPLYLNIFTRSQHMFPKFNFDFEIFSFLWVLSLHNIFFSDKEVVLEDIRSHRSDEDPAREDLTLEEYVIWTVHNNISMDFLNLIYQVKHYLLKSRFSEYYQVFVFSFRSLIRFQVCHIVLGLKPVSRQEEGKIVRGWMQREERRGYLTGQFWCLIAIDWWHSWEHYVTSPLKVR